MKCSFCFFLEFISKYVKYYKDRTKNLWDLLKNEKMVDFSECVCYNKNNQMEKRGRRNGKSVAFCI